MMPAALTCFHDVIRRYGFTGFVSEALGRHPSTRRAMRMSRMATMALPTSRNVEPEPEAEVNPPAATTLVLFSPTGPDWA